ncbi:DUF1835 domain-containing protein [Telluribacter sp.]|jgi:hypothetical protein|uniref:DUF1835 domain-containing protein n=1 Tax=Telluribacter sp. TaxID=1978767 RepID=UPI002E105696|nr:DUF1835 domain-containing protein [Telluribacter sp.]
MTTSLLRFHILNGDSLLESFPRQEIDGECIVARECLVVGDVGGTFPTEFWNNRAQYIQATYGEGTYTYYERVVAEFEKIQAIPPGSEVNLWFEEDLFCQVNLWFCLSLLLPRAKDLTLYIVKPFDQDGQPEWRGFGAMDSQDLVTAFQQRQAISLADVHLLASCWKAYQQDDRIRLKELGGRYSEVFPYLPLVCQAHLDRFPEGGQPGRPQQVLRAIKAEKQTDDFATIFSEFFRREGIYGFGDSQVRQLLEEL